MTDPSRRSDEDAVLRLQTIAEAMTALDAALRESRAFPDIPEPAALDLDEDL